MSEAPPGPRLGLAALLVLAGFLGLMIAATGSAAETGPYTTTQTSTTSTTSTTTTQLTTTTGTSTTSTTATSTTSTTTTQSTFTTGTSTTSTTSTPNTSTTSTTTTQPTTPTVSCYARECVGGGGGSQDDGANLKGVLIASPASPPSGGLTGDDVVQIVAILIVALGVAMSTVSTVQMRRNSATSGGAVRRSS